MRKSPFIAIPLGAALVGLAYACNSLLTESTYQPVAVLQTLGRLQLAHQRIAQDVGFSKTNSVLRVRLGETSRDFFDAVHSLQTLLPPEGTSTRNQCVAYMRTYLAETEYLLDDIDLFIRRAAVFQNSLDYALALVRKLQQRLMDEPSDSSKLINHILVNSHEALRIDRALTIPSLEQLRQSITQQLPHAPAGLKSDLVILRQHLDKLYELSPELDRLERRIVGSSAGAALEVAQDSTAQSNQEAIRKGIRVQRVLLCVAGALGVYLALSYWRLRRVSAQLQLANAALEDRVVEGTVELAARNRELVQAQKLEAVGQLAAGVAHELNTPMQYVHDNIEFLNQSTAVLMEILETLIAKADGSQPPQVWKQRWSEIAIMLETRGFDRLRTELPLSIQDALHGADRIIQIVRAMSQFTHPDSADFHTVNLNSALRDAAIVGGSRCNGLEISFDLDSDLPQVRCLPSQINQVLLNLLINAADAVTARKECEPDLPGRITLRSRGSLDGVRIEIQDNGTGIPENIRNRIFDPFFTTKQVGHGTGQGLAIAWRIVTELHCGKILVDSTLGIGTTFGILLPIDGSDVSNTHLFETSELDAELVSG